MSEKDRTIEAVKREISPKVPCVNADADGYCKDGGFICCTCEAYRPVKAGKKQNFTADHEAGLVTEIVSEGRPQAVRTAHRIARANRRSNTANIDAALGTVEKRGSGELALGTPHADRETREAQRQTVRELS